MFPNGTPDGFGCGAGFAAGAAADVDLVEGVEHAVSHTKPMTANVRWYFMGSLV